MGFTGASRRGKAIPIRLNVAYDKEKEIILAGLLTKNMFCFVKKKESEVKKKRIYMVSGVTKKKVWSLSRVGRTGWSLDKPAFKGQLGQVPGG